MIRARSSDLLMKMSRRANTVRSRLADKKKRIPITIEKDVNKYLSLFEKSLGSRVVKIRDWQAFRNSQTVLTFGTWIGTQKN